MKLENSLKYGNAANKITTACGIRPFLKLDNQKDNLKIAVISDSHGLLRGEVLKRLSGVDAIVHAGDIGTDEVLNQLCSVAQVYAVRGNTDNSPCLRHIPNNDCFEIGGRTFYLQHILEYIDIDPVAAEIDFVITGHTHQPALQEIQGVTYLNPGSIGPRRFDYPISMAFIEIKGQSFDINFVEFDK